MSYEKNIKLLKQCADEMAIRFLSPMYLVGSYVDKHETAKDIDLLLVVTDTRFKRLFGAEEDSNHMQRVFEFRKKQKLYFEMYIQNMDIDFKVVTLDGLVAVKKKRIKLDSLMEFPE